MNLRKSFTEKIYNALADLVQRSIFKPSDVKGAGAFYQLK